MTDNDVTAAGEGAGVLLVDDTRVLLQLRSGLVDSPGTWSVPGGMVRPGESAKDAAVREAREECGMDLSGVDWCGEYVSSVDGWTYTTLVGRVPGCDVTLHGSPEAVAHRWVPAGDVAGMPLHAGFRRSWSELAELAGLPAVVPDEPAVTAPGESMYAWRFDLVSEGGFRSPMRLRHGSGSPFVKRRVADCPHSPQLVDCGCGLFAVADFAELEPMVAVFEMQKPTPIIMVSRVLVENVQDAASSIRGLSPAVMCDGELIIYDPPSTVRGTALTMVGPCFTNHVGVPAMMAEFGFDDVVAVSLPRIWDPSDEVHPGEWLERDAGLRPNVRRRSFKVLSLDDMRVVERHYRRQVESGVESSQVRMGLVDRWVSSVV